MPSTESSFPTVATRQAVLPKGWFDPSRGEEDPLTLLKERFVELKEKISEGDKLAAEHVYHNLDLSMIDVRQHRFMLHYLLCKAEELALDFEILRRPSETADYVISLDGGVRRLEKIFQDWHGDPESASDIPESFKQAMREVRAGETEGMEADMFADNAAAET